MGVPVVFVVFALIAFVTLLQYSPIQNESVQYIPWSIVSVLEFLPIATTIMMIHGLVI